MKKLLISLAIAAAMIGIMVTPVMAAEGTRQASVTINEVISVTVADAGDNGINFGTLNQGATDQPDLDQGTSTPAVTVTMGSENNVDCDVSIKGTDFHTSIPVGSAKWAEGTESGTKNDMTTSFELVKSDVAASGVVDIWHFITVPANAAGGTFNSTFTYQAVKSS